MLLSIIPLMKWRKNWQPYNLSKLSGVQGEPCTKKRRDFDFKGVQSEPGTKKRRDLLSGVQGEPCTKKRPDIRIG
ncbi:MAG: hypothetical protein DRR19_06625 [Candidatus Parabeggiatoa sp. nov. 1]|nr:MAG: hypothetical protein DRR19_06625 [Gammaproteobacteria bacterium]